MKKFAKDFKVFVTRGNVINLAVAVIVGGAFGKIITSLVRDILMPIISLIIGKDGFANYKYIITEANPDLGIAENAINYGLFIQNIIDFVIIAFVIFLIIRLVARANTIANKKQIEEENIKKAEEERMVKEQAEIEAKKPKVEDLLTDIKVLLEKNLKS